MTSYHCAYCRTTFSSFSSTVDHFVEAHSDVEIKFTRKDTTCSKIFNFKIIPEICRQQGRTVTVNDKYEKIHVSRPNTIPKDSPCSKVEKISESLYEMEIGADDTDACNEEEEIDYGEVVAFLPAVIEELKRIGKYEEYLSFHRLVRDRKFPLNNIAFILFLDAVRWFCMDTTIVRMRYSEDVKLFWKTGLRLSMVGF